MVGHIISISLSLASICFTHDGIHQCYPVLIGPNTPTGEYTVTRRYTDQPGYGGDVLQFDENEKFVYAIHRVWTLIPQQQRVRRLKSDNIKDRYITSGCINVDPTVYDKLLDCCSTGRVIIKR